MEFHKKKAETAVQPLVPQGGFEPPQSEPESEVLPLHNRGMQCSINIQIYKKLVNRTLLLFHKFLIISRNILQLLQRARFSFLQGQLQRFLC